MDRRVLQRGTWLILLLLAPVASCAGSGVGDMVKPDLTQGTPLAASEACKAGQEDDRPFVINWDATDLALFESLAQRDVVLVKYQGCDLQVLDECQDEGVPGKYGAYEPTRWTSGTVEGFDVRNEGELYAKLPLGAATLSSKVAAGQSLTLSYYVSGTRTATRRSLYAGDIGANPACAGATHFVWGYNLGAFELNSSERTEVEAEAGAFNVGAGGANRNEANRLRKGGDLPSCTSDSARDLAACKVPLRLVLRNIKTGDKPGATAGAEPAAANADPGGAGATLTPAMEAHKLRVSAAGKFQMGDGFGCLAELDRARELNPDPDAEKNFESVRAQCEMKAGKCEDGKKRYRQWLLKTPATAKLTGPQIDRAVSQQGSQHCISVQQGPEDVAKRAPPAIHKAMDAGDTGSCIREANDLLEALPKLPQRDINEERFYAMSVGGLNTAALCAARGGNCKEARRLYTEFAKKTWGKAYKGTQLKTALDAAFKGQFSQCAGK